MKTSFLITIGIITAVAISIASISLAYNQDCNSDGGHVVGFLQCTYTRDKISSAADKYDAKTLECFSLLFHCDASSEYFEGCISGKKDGMTVEEICTNAVIDIKDGCATIQFDKNNAMITCD